MHLRNVRLTRPESIVSPTQGSGIHELPQMTRTFDAGQTRQIRMRIPGVLEPLRLEPLLRPVPASHVQRRHETRERPRKPTVRSPRVLRFLELRVYHREPPFLVSLQPVGVLLMAWVYLG